MARPDPSWAHLYKVGGLSAILFVLLVLIPVVLVFAAPVPPVDGRALLPYIAAHKVVYLTELVCFVGLSVPALVVFSAVAVALKHANKSMAAIGGLFGVVSEVIALALGSSPQSLHGGLVLLSNSYSTAQTDAERAGLVSAADALIAATNAVSWAGILTAAGILILSLVMRSANFGHVVALIGVLTGVTRDRQRGAAPDDRPGVHDLWAPAPNLVRARGLEAPPAGPARPAMSTIHGTLDIARPVEDVFDFVADQRNEPTYNPKMTASAMLTDGPIGVGTRYAATVLSRGKPLPMTIEVTGFDRPRRIASRSVMTGATVDGYMQFEPISGGTRLSWDWKVTIGGLGRLAGPLIVLIGRQQERTIWTSLKHHLEDSSAVGR